MAVWALGLNYQTAPVDLRGRFAFSSAQLPPALSGLRERQQGSSELAILSTCNRTEVYGVSGQQQIERTLHWLADTGGVAVEALHEHIYLRHEAEAARHAFRVASGLDSMVLGEPEILGQMKQAVHAAQDAGALGGTLNQLFQRSFAVAKEVRTVTEIGAHSISMAAAAVRLSEQLFEDLRQIRVLFVGAGEMIELAATHFASRRPRGMAIANRTLARSERLADQFGAEAMRLADMPHRMHEFDAIITSTASTLPLIGLGAVRRCLKQRRHRPLFMVDLAVPRDIESDVGRLGDVYLYTIDDLSHIVQTGQASREAAVAQAEVIIDAGVQSFVRWLDQRDPEHGIVPVIKQLKRQTDHWQAIELERARRRLTRGEDVELILQSLSRGLTRKMLHGSMAELHSADRDRREKTVDAIQRFFLRQGRSD